MHPDNVSALFPNPSPSVSNHSNGSLGKTSVESQCVSSSESLSTIVPVPSVSPEHEAQASKSDAKIHEPSSVFNVDEELKLHAIASVHPDNVSALSPNPSKSVSNHSNGSLGKASVASQYVSSSASLSTITPVPSVSPEHEAQAVSYTHLTLPTTEAV